MWTWVIILLVALCWPYSLGLMLVLHRQRVEEQDRERVKTEVDVSANLQFCERKKYGETGNFVHVRLCEACDRQEGEPQAVCPLCLQGSVCVWQVCVWVWVMALCLSWGYVCAPVRVMNATTSPTSPFFLPPIPQPATLHPVHEHSHQQHPLPFFPNTNTHILYIPTYSKRR